MARFKYVYILPRDVKFKLERKNEKFKITIVGDKQIIESNRYHEDLKEYLVEKRE